MVRVNPIIAFGQRLKVERQRLGMSQEAFATLGRVHKNSQIKYEKGETPPSIDYLFALQDQGIDVPRLLNGEDPQIAVARGAIGSVLRSPKSSYKAPPAELDLVEVKEIDLTYGLGGTFADTYVETQSLYFERGWIESITHTSPTYLTFARGRGDSMQPTVHDGDIVLIDRSIRNVREQDAIWALTIGDIAMIKRIRVRGETVLILSDNDRVPPDEVHHEQVNVVGRVVFVGRKL